jgi:hypothetical protein
MLTFFDYLRQRAYESILSGAQEALEEMETQQNRKVGKSRNLKLPAAAQDTQAERSGEKSNQPSSPASDSESDEELLPAPRRRGRPRKQSKGKP